MARRAPGALVLVVAVAALLVPAGDAPAAPRKPTKTRCPAGTTPVVKAKGRKVVAARDKRGRLKCRAIRTARPPAPGATPAAQASQVTDALRSAAGTAPGALARLQRAIGRRRAAKLLDVALEGWKPSVGLRPGRVRARAAVSTTWKGTDGVDGSASFDLSPQQGADSGFRATAAAELTATRAGVEKLSPDLKEKLPPNVTKATGRVDVSFSDTNQTCAVDGKQRGTVKATGKVKVSVERSDGPPVELELGADVEVGYTAAADEQGRWTGIESAEVQATFSSSATGESTKVFRARRVAKGLGTEAIIDSKDWGAALARDGARFDANAGGIFGPKGAWNFERGIGISDIRSIDNFKGMYATSVASALLSYAAFDYLRKVARERAEKGACKFEAHLLNDGRVESAGYSGTGRIDVTIPLKGSGDGRTWEGTASVVWRDVVLTSKDECSVHSPVSDGGVTVRVTRLDSGRLLVDWGTIRGASMTVSVTCPGDPPSTASGLPGLTLAGVAPMSFELAPEAGEQRLSGGVDAGPDGTSNDGALVINVVR